MIGEGFNRRFGSIVVLPVRRPVRISWL